MSTSANSRASLLAGLRTGGVRSVSAQQPSTAPLSPSASSFPRSATYDTFSPPHTADDAFAESFAQMRFAQTADPRAQANALRMQQQQQQQQMMYNMMGVSQEEMIYMAKIQQQQQVQLELMRLQALQQQAQAQAQILALQAQQQHVAQAQAQQQQMRYALEQQQPHQHAQAASAGPYTSHSGNFESLRSAASSAAARRASQNVRTLEAGGGEGEPMTAPPNGRFPSATRLNPNANVFRSSMLAAQQQQEESSPPISAGFVSSESTTGTGRRESNATPPRKSDVATSWRRGSMAAAAAAAAGTTPSPPSSHASTSPVRKSVSPSPPLLPTPPPTVVVSRPDEFPLMPVTPTSTTSTSTRTAHRPKPLQLSATGSTHALAELVQSHRERAEVSDTPSPPALSSSPTSSSPTSLSPTSAHNPVPVGPLETSKRMYEGIGIGRPPPTPTALNLAAAAVVRQPRGPPSGAEDLGMRNFAGRIRRRAIGGLEVLKSAREGRGEGLGVGEGVLVY